MKKRYMNTENKYFSEIVTKYMKWKESKDDGYIYDEIHDFIAELSRSELLEVFEYMERTFKKP